MGVTTIVVKIEILARIGKEIIKTHNIGIIIWIVRFDILTSLLF